MAAAAVAIGAPELALLRRIHLHHGGRFAPHPARPDETASAVKLAQAGYLEDDPREAGDLVLTALAHEYLEMLLG